MPITPTTSCFPFFALCWFPLIEVELSSTHSAWVFSIQKTKLQTLLKRHKRQSISQLRPYKLPPHSDLSIRRQNHFDRQQKMKNFINNTLKCHQISDLFNRSTKKKAIHPADKQRKPTNEAINPRSSKNTWIIHQFNLKTGDWIQT